MKKIFLYLTVIPCLFIVLIQPACNPTECFKRTGDIVQEERTVNDFTTILVNDNVEIVLRNDSSRTVTVEAGKNLISSVKTVVEGSILKISNENTCNWARSFKNQIKVSVGAMFVQKIEQYGFNQITNTDTLEVNDLNILCKNSGDINLVLKANHVQMFTSSTSYIRLAGSANTSGLHTNGMGEILAQNFKVQELNVLHENINEIHVFPVKSLNVTFNPLNTGNVTYYNEPDNISVSGTGKGKVIKR